VGGGRFYHSFPHCAHHFSGAKSLVEKRMGVLVMQAVSKRRSRTVQFSLGKTAVYIILILGSIVAILPFVWMILASFKTGGEIRQIPPTFFPQEWTLDNFRTIFNDENLPLLTFYGNSAFVAIMNTTIDDSWLFDFSEAEVTQQPVGTYCWLSHRRFWHLSHYPICQVDSQ
jgi:hypothetical protein